MKSNEICHVATTSFHNEIGSDKYPLSFGRYWLFTSKLCPYAHRTEIARKLSGMDVRIGLTIAGSIQTEKGWNLARPYKTSANSPIPDIAHLPGIYQMAEPGYTGRASVPVLFDRKTETIVNNESSEIIRMFDSLANGESNKTLYPTAQSRYIDKVISFLNDQLISPMYLAGFAKSQTAYEFNYNQVFGALNALEKHLSETGPFITGESLTLADVHAFPHLVRFDAIYHTLYRLNEKFISDYARISEYLELLASIPAFSSTLDLEAAKEGYFRSWNQPTFTNFVPSGPVVNPLSGVLANVASVA